MRVVMKHRETRCCATAVLLFALSALPASAQSPAPRAKRAAPAPDRAELLKRAADARQSGNRTEAMRLLQLAGDRHQSVHAYLELARLQSTGGDAAAALETLSKARAIAPNSEDVLSAYAQLSLATRQPLPALLTLEAMTRLFPSVAQYHYLLGVSLMGVGDMPSAEEELQAANRLEPDRPLTLLALGLVRNNRKQFDEAKPVLTRTLDMQPENVDAIAALAEAEAGLGNLDVAVANAERALKHAAGHVTANIVLGMVLMERRQYADARDRFLKAADSDPDSSKAAYQLSLVYARLGDDERARHYRDLHETKVRALQEKLKMLRSSPGR